MQAHGDKVLAILGPHFGDLALAQSDVVHAILLAAQFELRQFRFPGFHQLAAAQRAQRCHILLVPRALDFEETILSGFQKLIGVEARIHHGQRAIVGAVERQRLLHRRIIGIARRCRRLVGGVLILHRAAARRQCRSSRRFVFPVKKIRQTAEQKNFNHPESTAAHTATHTTEAAGPAKPENSIDPKKPPSTAVPRPRMKPPDCGIIDEGCCAC